MSTFTEEALGFPRGAAILFMRDESKVVRVDTGASEAEMINLAILWDIAFGQHERSPVSFLHFVSKPHLTVPDIRSSSLPFPTAGMGIDERLGFQIAEGLLAIME
jgi:hypothetical protein